jgi:uncharacterized protein
MEDVILWQRLDQPGHEACRFVPGDLTQELVGTAVFVEQHQPCRLDYRIVCDAHWQTRTATIEGWIGQQPIAISLSVDAQHRWHSNGHPITDVTGCIDLDLNFSPVTNLLPIRRLNLAVGQAAEVRAAWLRMPTLHLEPLAQVYRRLDPTTYQYESGGGAFIRQIQVNPTGFVTSYPDFWKQQA